MSQSASVATLATASEESSLIKQPKTPTVRVSPDVLRENRIIAGMAPGAALDAYRLLRTRVLQAMAARKANLLAVTSPGPGAGKSLTTINLAAGIAMDVGRTVLLVDADLRRPRLHSYFGLSTPECGLAEYLSGKVPLEACLLRPGSGRLTLLPAGTPQQASSELLASPRMRTFVEEVKQRYTERTIIIDLPPLLTSDDALALLPLADAALLVIEDGRTRIDELHRCAELLAGSCLLGTVLNKVRRSGRAAYAQDLS